MKMYVFKGCLLRFLVGDNLFYFIDKQFDSDGTDFGFASVLRLYFRMNESLRMNGCTIVCIMDIRYERKEDRKR
ncbi:hypothetical protein EG487_11100 [Paenibacillus polymyxa]|nr:hypothetical protein EG487_11100 [Paenibacillus polymyxa]